MKKWLAIPALAGAVVLGGVAMVANADKSESAAKSDEILPVEEVETKTVEAVDGHVAEVEYGKSQDKHETELKNECNEYDFDNGSTNGEITSESKSAHKEQSISLSVLKDDKNKKKFKNHAKYITADEAIEIAMKTVQGTVTELELDSDDGRVHYEIEIEDGVYEYEFEIDAITGEVLDFEKELDD